MNVSNDRLKELNKKIDKLNKSSVETELPKVEHGKPKPYVIMNKRPIHHRIVKYFKKQKCYLINMELLNGMHRTFLISIENDEFFFNGGKYIIDSEFKYYNIDDKIYCLDYKQNICLPIKRYFDSAEILTALETSQVSNVENAINPKILDDFVERKVIEQVMRGQDFEEVLKSIKIGVFVAAGAAVVHLVIFVFKSGMLEGVKSGIGI